MVKNEVIWTNFSPGWSNAGMASPSGALTLSISVWPSDASVCSLSAILETGALPQRYFLSPKACAGILRRAETPLTCNRQVAKGSFPKYGWSGNLAQELQTETGRVLSRWGDAGWGTVVARDKHNGRFCVTAFSRSKDESRRRRSCWWTTSWTRSGR